MDQFWHRLQNIVREVELFCLLAIIHKKSCHLPSKKSGIYSDTEKKQFFLKRPSSNDPSPSSFSSSSSILSGHTFQNYLQNCLEMMANYLTIYLQNTLIYLFKAQEHTDCLEMLIKHRITFKWHLKNVYIPVKFMDMQVKVTGNVYKPTKQHQPCTFSTHQTWAIGT